MFENMLVFYLKYNVSGWKLFLCKVDSIMCVFLLVIIYRIFKIKCFMMNFWKKRYNKFKIVWYVICCEVFYKYVGGLYF